jgi:hypothetical protein
MSKAITRALRKLLWSTHGNGEIVGVCVCVALAVGAGVIAARTLGTGAKTGATQLGAQAAALSVQ